MDKASLSETNLLLRGCILRNTTWVYGIVIYAGHETKIMMNGNKPEIKHSSVGATMNRYILFICLVQLLICIFAALYTDVW